MEKRHFSIINLISEKQGQAWEMEHQAIGENEFTRNYFFEQAKEIRTADTEDRITLLFTRSDMQNMLIDLYTGAEKKTEDAGVIYTLLEQ